MMNAMMKKRLSKSMGVLAAALFLTPVLAAPAPVSKKVFERPLQDEEVTAHFAVNRDLGRAWIDIEVIPFTSGQLREPQSFPQALNGLYYDKARKQVLYRDGKDTIVCAEDSTFLWDKSLKETGQCRLLVSQATRWVDDGFNGQNKNIGTVVFETSSSPSSQASN